MGNEKRAPVAMPTGPEPSKGPAAWAIFDPAVDPVEHFREHLSFGSGDVHCVWLPDHPRTNGEHPRPDHAVLAAITGNGPTSEANAKFIAWCLTSRDQILTACHDWNCRAAPVSVLPEGWVEMEGSGRAVSSLPGTREYFAQRRDANGCTIAWLNLFVRDNGTMWFDMTGASCDMRALDYLRSRAEAGHG